MSLPSRPDLTRLKHVARRLQRCAVAGETEALRRIHACFPDVAPQGIKLWHAQLVLAREYGSASWPTLIVRVEKRIAKRKAAASRAQARVADAAALAERWFALARSENLQELVVALAVGKARMMGARDVMQRERAHYDAFLDVLLAGTANTNARIRFECAHALDSFGDTRCREPLFRLMDDPVPRVRRIAIHALSCHACNEASCVDDRSVHKRIAQHALSDASIQVRRHAAGALGTIAAPTTVDALRAIIARDTDPGLLRAARWALSRCNAAKEAAGEVGSPNASQGIDRKLIE